MKIFFRIVFPIAFLAGIITTPFALFAADPPTTAAELRQMLEAERMRAERIRLETERLNAEEAARVNQPAIRITDPATQAFANLPYVVRIRIRDASGTNFGTGSVILSKDGRATILTAGHIFKKFDDKSKIEVDIFNPETGKIETLSGSAIKWDLESDVGLLSIPMSRPIVPLTIASLEDAATAGQQVFSYGCGASDPPSPQRHRVTVLNRYLGPDNVECTGVPIQGRSGGGLVDDQNRLIGVIIAADTRDQRGLHAGLRPIYDLLRQARIDLRTLPCTPPPLPRIP